MCGSEDPELLQPEIESLLTSGVLASFRVTLEKFHMKNLGIDPNRPECCMFLFFKEHTTKKTFNSNTKV